MHEPFSEIFSYYLCVVSTYYIHIYIGQHLSIVSVLEIAAGHLLFSNQFQHLANQNPCWLAKFTVHFQWDNNQKPTKNG